MLRALPLVAVRQKQSEPANPAPFGFAGADELIDDYLCSVRKVAKLAFPDDERVGLGRRITVLEAHDRLLREDRIDDLETRLVLADMLQRNIRTVAFLIVQHRVPVEKSSARAVLTGEAHGEAVLQQ